MSVLPVQQRQHWWRRRRQQCSTRNYIKTGSFMFHSFVRFLSLTMALSGSFIRSIAAAALIFAAVVVVVNNISRYYAVGTAAAAANNWWRLCGWGREWRQLHVRFGSVRVKNILTFSGFWPLFRWRCTVRCAKESLASKSYFEKFVNFPDISM